MSLKTGSTPTPDFHRAIDDFLTTNKENFTEQGGVRTYSGKVKVNIAGKERTLCLKIVVDSGSDADAKAHEIGVKLLALATKYEVGKKTSRIKLNDQGFERTYSRKYVRSKKFKTEEKSKQYVRKEHGKYISKRSMGRLNKIMKDFRITLPTTAATTTSSIFAAPSPKTSAPASPPASAIVKKTRASKAAKITKPTIEKKIGKIKLTVKEGDVTKEKCDAIVNAANPQLKGGPDVGGVCRAIWEAGGDEIFEESKKQLRPGGKNLEPGDGVMTGPGKLKHTKHVIHAVAPDMRGKPLDDKARGALKAAYNLSLEHAHSRGLKSIALPSLGTGIYNFPKEEAAKIAMEAVQEFENRHPKTTLTDIRFLWNETMRDEFAKANP